MIITKLIKFVLPDVLLFIRISAQFKFYWMHSRDVIQIIFNIEISKVTKFHKSFLSFKRRKFFNTINQILITDDYF